MGEEAAELRVKLVLDDAASSTAAKVGQGLDHAQKSAHGANHELGGMKGAAAGVGASLLVALAAATAVAAAVYEGASAMKVLGMAALEAAAAEEDQVRALTESFALMDQGAHSMDDLRRYASGVKDELEDVGIKSGVAADEITNAYQAVIERGELGTEAAKKLTEQMAEVGKVTKGGLGGLAAGFEAIELGMVKAKNPVVQLIAATHTLHGNAKQVAAQLQKMTSEQQMQLAQQAVSKQADSMGAGTGAVPQTLGQLEKGLDGVKDKFLEAVGAPMLHRIIPPLTAIRDYLASHMDQIEVIGRKVGAFFGDLIDSGSQILGQVYDAFVKNWDDISNAAKRTWAAMKTAFGMADTTTDDIARKLVSAVEQIKTIFDAISASVTAIGDTLHLAAKTWEGIGEAMQLHFAKAGEAFKDAIRPLEEDVGGKAPGRGSKKYDDSYSKAGGAAGDFGEFSKGGTSGAQQAWEESIAKLSALVDASSKDEAKLLQNDIDTLSEFREQRAAAYAAMKDEVASEGGGAIADFQKYIDQAVETHNEGALSSAISIVQGSAIMQAALADGSLKIGDGFDTMIGAVAERSTALANKLKEMADVVKGEGGIKPGTGGVTQNFSGGQTFHIKQDFRDADPDAIALVFRKDIFRAATARTQSRMSGAFGM